MSTVKRRTRQRIATTPDTLAQFWAGEPPPSDRAATPDDHELVVGAVFFAWSEGEVPAHISWTHHPHQAEWLDWIRSTEAPKSRQ